MNIVSNLNARGSLSAKKIPGCERILDWYRCMRGGKPVQIQNRVRMKTETFLFTLLLLVVVGGAGIIARQNSYYRGVYDACIQVSAVNGQVTTFDIINCKEITARARAGDWYYLESLKP